MFAPKCKAQIVTEKTAQLFNKDKSLSGQFRSNIAFALSIMIRKNFDLSQKGKELLAMLEGEIENTKLRRVIEYEKQYIMRSFEHELEEKENKLEETENELEETENKLEEKENELKETENENKRLKEILKENGIEY